MLHIFKKIFGCFSRCTNDPNNRILTGMPTVSSFLAASGMPSSTGSNLDCVQDENPPHWLKSLQALTEVDGPSGSVVSQPRHSGLLDSSVRLPLHRGGWAPYLPPPSLAASHFHSPPPGFQTAFRPPAQTTADLLQSAAMERH